MTITKYLKDFMNKYNNTKVKINITDDDDSFCTINLDYEDEIYMYNCIYIESPKNKSKNWKFNMINGVCIAPETIGNSFTKKSITKVTNSMKEGYKILSEIKKDFKDNYSKDMLAKLNSGEIHGI